MSTLLHSCYVEWLKHFLKTFRCDLRPAPSPTSVGVVQVDELLPLVVRQQAEDGSSEGGAHLDDKLHLVIGGEAGRDEGGVQRAAEGGQGVHGLPVVESEDGVDAAGELGANCGRKRVTISNKLH